MWYNCVFWGLSGGVLWRTAWCRHSSSSADDANCVSVRQRCLSWAIATSSVGGMLHHFKPTFTVSLKLCWDGPVSCDPALALQTEVALECSDPPSWSHGLSNRGRTSAASLLQYHQWGAILYSTLQSSVVLTSVFSDWNEIHRIWFWGKFHHRSQQRHYEGGQQSKWQSGWVPGHNPV